MFQKLDEHFANRKKHISQNTVSNHKTGEMARRNLTLKKTTTKWS